MRAVHLLDLAHRRVAPQPRRPIRSSRPHPLTRARASARARRVPLRGSPSARSECLTLAHGARILPGDPRSSRSERAGIDGHGALAQLGERSLCKREVVGSNPIGSTTRPRERSGRRDIRPTGVARNGVLSCAACRKAAERPCRTHPRPSHRNRARPTRPTVRSIGRLRCRMNEEVFLLTALPAVQALGRPHLARSDPQGHQIDVAPPVFRPPPPSPLRHPEVIV